MQENTCSARKFSRKNQAEQFLNRSYSVWDHCLI